MQAPVFLLAHFLPYTKCDLVIHVGKLYQPKKPHWSQDILDSHWRNLPKVTFPAFYKQKPTDYGINCLGFTQKITYKRKHPTVPNPFSPDFSKKTLRKKTPEISARFRESRSQIAELMTAGEGSGSQLTRLTKVVKFVRLLRRNPMRMASDGWDRKKSSPVSRDRGLLTEGCWLFCSAPKAKNSRWKKKHLHAMGCDGRWFHLLHMAYMTVQHFCPSPFPIIFHPLLL